jgi:hypothetical protein
VRLCVQAKRRKKKEETAPKPKKGIGILLDLGAWGIVFFFFFLFLFSCVIVVCTAGLVLHPANGGPHSRWTEADTSAQKVAYPFLGDGTSEKGTKTKAQERGRTLG